jgi:hypothetical protein
MPWKNDILLCKKVLVKFGRDSKNIEEKGRYNESKDDERVSLILPNPIETLHVKPNCVLFAFR